MDAGDEGKILELGAAPPRRRPGRPKGSTNKRTSDLREYIALKFDGLTPGQQLAEAFMVTDRERRDAGGLLPALAKKASQLALDLGCKKAEAFKLILDGQRELMAYIHPKLSSVEMSGKDGAPLLPTIIMPGPAPTLGLFDQPDETFTIQPLIEGVTSEVGQLKSDE